MGPMDMGVDLNNLSQTDYAQSADLNPNYLVYEGYGTVVAKAGADIPVKLSTPVRKIRYGEGKGVRVETDAGTIEARAVIVTVSTGVLAAGLIRFDPELPDWKAGSDRLCADGTAGENPDADPGRPPRHQAVRERADRISPAAREIYFLAWPWESDLMVGFVGGDFGWQLSAAGEDAAIDFAKERLAQDLRQRRAEESDQGAVHEMGEQSAHARRLCGGAAMPLR